MTKLKWVDIVSAKVQETNHLQWNNHMQENGHRIFSRHQTICCICMRQTEYVHIRTTIRRINGQWLIINRFSKFVLIMATDKYIQSVHFISLAIKVTPTFIVDTFAVCFLASHSPLIVLYEILCKVLFRDCQEPIMFYLGIIVFPIDYEYAQISYLLYLDVHRA